MSIPRRIRGRVYNLVPIGAAVWQSPKTFDEILTPLNPQKLPLLNSTSKCSHWCLMGPSCSTFVHYQIHLYYICKIDSQLVKPFDKFPSLLNCWSHKTTQNVGLGYCGANCLSLCPFPDESTDVYQIWCKSVQPFDSFPRLLNVWPPTPPPTCPLGYWGVTCI